MSKLKDFDKVKKVILSCKTTRQALVAYEVVERFGTVHRDKFFYEELYDVCDAQMVKIMEGRK